MAFCCTSNSFTWSGWLHSGRLDCGESANPPPIPVAGFMGLLEKGPTSKFRASRSKTCWLPLQAKRRELDVRRFRWNWLQGKEKNKQLCPFRPGDKNELPTGFSYQLQYVKLQYVERKSPTAVATTRPSAAVWRHFSKADGNSNLRHGNTNGIAARCSP